MSRRGSESDRLRTFLLVVALLLVAGTGPLAAGARKPAALHPAEAPSAALPARRPVGTPTPALAPDVPDPASTPSTARAPGAQPQFPLIAILNYHDLSADPRARLEVVSP